MKALTSKERVLRAFACQEPDRVPVNYFANAGIDAKLKRHLSLAPDDGEGLRLALGVDFRGSGPAYKGPKLHADIPERGIVCDNWGVRRTWIEHGSGGYWDFCEFPLKDAGEDAVASWPMPSPDDFDYGGVAAQCRGYARFAVSTGGPGVPDIINGNTRLRGMEQTLIDLITEEPAGLLLARRRVEIELEIMRRTLEAAEGGIDFIWLGEDLGTQIAPLISLDLYRSAIKPAHKLFCDLAKSFGIPVMIHSCGSSSWAYEDFIELGIKAVDTLQPEARDMAPAQLKRRFGGRLAFHGCISTAGPLADGTPEETARYCRDTLEVMKPGGGYCFAPTHSIQDNSPLENVLAMYDAAKRYGAY